MLNICPEIEEASSEIKKEAILATSLDERIFLSGCLSTIFSITLSFLSIFEASSVLVMVGAMALILTFGASSDPNVLTRPSIPDFATETEA